MSHLSLNETAPQACLPFAVLAKYINSLRQMPDRLTHPAPLDLSAYVTHSGTPFSLRDNININDDRDVISGGFGDVRKDRIVIGSDIFFVAVKRIRNRNYVSQERMNIRVRREVKVWKGLGHENIVQLLGIIEHDGCVGMVSPWMAAGDLHSFIHSNVPLSRRLDIACDSARGVAYLHSKDIIHGDLTCKNILIDDQGKACITDFGLSIIRVEFDGTHYMTGTVGGAMRYKAPELVPSNSDEKEVINFKPVLTSACDVWSLASVILQTLTGVVPYDNVSQDICVVWYVMRAFRPRRPQVEELTDEYWDYINTMWGQPGAPYSRPRAEEVYRSLLIFRDTA